VNGGSRGARTVPPRGAAEVAPREWTREQFLRSAR